MMFSPATEVDEPALPADDAASRVAAVAAPMASKAVMSVASAQTRRPCVPSRNSISSLEVAQLERTRPAT